MPFAAPVEDALDSYLRDIATVVWRKTRRVARTVYGVKGEGVNERECLHYAQTAAFLGFVECGGDPTAYATFDWAGRRRELIKAAHHHMLQFLRRSDQTYDVDRLPLKRRHEVVAVDQYRWDVWDQPSGIGYTPSSDDLPGTYTPLTGQEYEHEDADQERDLMEGMLQELGSVLAAALSDKDWQLLEEHYFRGRSQREIAADLGLSEGTLNVRMHRVRERARKALEASGTHWRDLFTDILV